ncbi:MAG TPA: M23 family metallopeptidase [Mycobacteriales bacterium]|nr:M23 family metallopeptidase [Mycobacteriales bacterium]
MATVGGSIAALVATGPGGGLTPVAATTPAVGSPATATATATVASSVLRVPTAQQARVAQALRALDVAGDRGVRVSRSARRVALRPRHVTAPAHRWVRPNAGPLTSGFGYRWGRLHAGIDLAGPYGSPIVAATDGCITYAGPMEGYGEVIDITDWDGTQTAYGHMSSFVRRAGCVHAGELIARVGSAGDATGPHLHFEVHVGGRPVDPIPFLAKRGLRI